MIYCYCDQCGLSFSKGHYKKPKCLRCGSDDLWEEDIPDEDLTEVDRVIDRMQRAALKKKL